jgi:hypothetical protein
LFGRLTTTLPFWRSMSFSSSRVPRSMSSDTDMSAAWSYNLLNGRMIQGCSNITRYIQRFDFWNLKCNVPGGLEFCWVFFVIYLSITRQHRKMKSSREVVARHPGNFQNINKLWKITRTESRVLASLPMPRVGNFPFT